MSTHPTLRSIELPEAAANPGSGSPVVHDRLAALKGVKVRVAVVAGHTDTTIAQLIDLKSGAVLPLDRAIGAGFSLMLEDKVIAVGELVAVGEQFGLRITELGQPAAAT
ncbi:MAG TPA: FliM/FliN family flagellar motor switch protein [Burkholderiaceae bacterium]|nr:FliM/FliN family flagellar motor switch protein [Burkholderiaceae bacterium]